MLLNAAELQPTLSTLHAKNGIAEHAQKSSFSQFTVPVTPLSFSRHDVISCKNSSLGAPRGILRN